MDFDKRFAENNRVTVLELKAEAEARLQPYWYGQSTLLGRLFRGRLPANWREQWRASCAELAAEGFITDPQSIQEVEDYLDAWARFCGLQPLEEAAAKQYTITIERHDEGDTPAATPPQQTKPLSPSWPQLTPQEKERAQSLTGLPWWYPLRPSNRMDSMWAKIFVRIGREGRNRLEDCYREIAALGRLVKAIENDHENALEKLEAQRKRVQAAYDEYVLARAEINSEWARYLRTESFVGPEIQALVEKLDGALPTRIDGFKSSSDGRMKASLKAVQQATGEALSRAERQHTIAVWTDRVVTAIQLVTVGVTVGKAAVKVFTEVAKQSGKKAAVKVVAKFVAVELSTAAAAAGVGAIVIPEVLAAAGLDPVEVQIGLAAYGAIGALSPIVAAHASRRIALRKRSDSGERTDGPRRKRRLAPKDYEKPSPEEARRKAGIAFNKARENSYPYNEVPIAKIGRGKPYILDSYDPIKGEIVFRRNCQFSEIQLKTARAYFREFKSKYPPGSTIADVPSAGELAGQELRGRMIFEVPPQWKKVPSKVLQMAEEFDITIRDSNGKMYHAD